MMMEASARLVVLAGRRKVKAKGCRPLETGPCGSPGWWFRPRVTSTSLTTATGGENMGRRW